MTINMTDRTLLTSTATASKIIATSESKPGFRVTQSKIVWRNVIMFVILHIGALYGVYLFMTRAKWQTCVFAYILYVVTAISIAAGAHRLWSHRTYKAKLPLRVILLWFFTMAFQNSVVEWVRDHRVHHKFCDTDADPHNSHRGFFFSHMGWLMVKKHPDVLSKGRTIDMSDLLEDPLLHFQNKHYLKLVTLVCFVLPTIIPTLWGETAWVAFYVAVLLRYTFTLHVTWLINSAAHMWGNKPYDKNIRPVEIMSVSLLAVGEGFHNYHHTFPWDYRSGELGGYSLNWAKLFIDIMTKIGWAYDLKSVPLELVKRRAMRTGDGTHPVWGWNDSDIMLEDRESTVIR
ncbi:acyl-CoA Delta-9 desaturase-like [Anticarsia gemmatalis]|uniref:acyl-CoA Delta-9 desaturase-like n=1 Tax=Anticarsia gemmatalis TaxID=129554 RepID=UPI003F75A68D